MSPVVSQIPVLKARSEEKRSGRRSLFPCRPGHKRSLSDVNALSDVSRDVSDVRSSVEEDVVKRIRTDEMDKGKSEALLAWVNALKVGAPVKSMKDFVDGTVMVNILNACTGDLNSSNNSNNNNNNSSVSPSQEEALGKMCAVEDFLQGFYQTHLTEKLNLEAVMENGDEFEVGKALMLLFGAAVQSSNRQHFVQLAMTLTNDQQSEIKDIIEPLLMKEGMTMPVIPEDYHTVLKTKMTISPPVQTRPPVARNLYADSPLRTVRGADTFPDSPLTPIKAIVASPQMACKLKLRECEKRVRELEAVVTEERHLRSEMEWQLQDKQTSLDTAETRITELDRRLHELNPLQDKVDELEVLRHDKAKFQAENEKLRTKLSDMGQLKSNFQLMTKENEELLQSIFTLQDQLKDNTKLKETLSASEQRLASMEERYRVSETTIDERNRSIKVLEEALRDVQRELEAAREAHRENLLQTEERLGLSVMQSPVGESMSCFTQKRIDELQSEISSLIGQEEALSEQLQTRNVDLQTANEHIEALRNEKEEIEKELEHSRTLVVDSETKLNNLTIQIGQLNGEMVEIKTEKNDWHIKYCDEKEHHEQDVGKLRKEIQRKEADFEAEIQEYKDTITGLREEYKAKKVEVEQCFESKVKTLQEQQSQISELNSKLIANMNSVSEKNEAFQKKLHACERKLNDAKDEIKEREKTIDHLQKSLNEKNELMSTMKGDLEGVRFEMDNVQKLLISSESEESRLKMTIQELENDKVTLHEEIGTLRDELNSHYVELSTVEAKLHNTEEDHEEERVKFEEEKKLLEDKLQLKDDELCTLRETNLSLQTTIQEQEQHLTLLETNNEKLSEEKNKLLKDLESREIEIETKAESIEELLQGLKSERERVNQYTIDCENYQTSLTSYEDEKMSMHASILELESKLTTKEQEFTKLEEEKGQLSEKLETSGEHIAKLEYERLQIQTEKDSLMSLQQLEVEQWSKQMEELTAEIETLKNQHREELEALARNLSSSQEETVNLELRYQAEITSLNQKIEEKEDEVADVQKKIEELNEEIQEEKKTREEAKKEYEHKLVAKEEEMTSLEAKLSSLKSEHTQKMEENKEHVQRLEELIETGDENVSNLETKLIELESQKKNVEAELQEEKMKSFTLEATVQGKENQLQEVIFTTKNEVAEKESVISLKEDEIETLKEEKMMLQTLSQSQNEQLEDIHKAHSELECKHKLLVEDKTALEYVHSELETNFYSMEAAKERLEKDVQNMKNDAVEKNAEFDKARELMEEEYQTKFDDLSRVKADLQRHLSEADTKVTSLKAKADLVTSDKEKLERRLAETLKEDLEKFAAMETDLSEKIEQIAVQTMELTQTHELLEQNQDKVRVLEADNEDLNAALASREEVIAVLKTSAENSETLIAEQEEEIQELKTKCECLETKMNESEVRMQKKMDEQIQEFFSSKKEMEEEMSELSQKLNENETQIQELLTRCNSLSKTNSDQKDFIDKLETKKTDLTRELQSRDVTITDHVIQLQGYSTRLDQVTARNAELERRLEESELRNESLSQEVEESSQKSTRTEDEYETRLSTLKANLTETQNQLLEMTSQNNELIRKLEQNGQQVAKMELSKIEMETEFKSKSQKLGLQISALEDNIQHLERKNMNYRSECLELQEALNQKIQDIKDYELRGSSDEDVINGLQTIISGLQSEKSDLITKVSAKEELISSLKSDVSSLQSGKSEVEQAVTMEKERSRSLESRHQVLQAKLQSLEKKCSDLECKLKNEHEPELCEVERRLDVECQLKAKFQEAFQKEEAERKYLELKAEKLKTKNNDLESEIRRLRTDMEFNKTLTSSRRSDVTTQPTPSPPNGPRNLDDSLEMGVSRLVSPKTEETLRNSAGKLTVQQLESDTESEQFVSAHRVFGSDTGLARLRHPSNSSSLYSSQQSIYSYASDCSRASNLQQHMGTLFSCEDEPEVFQWNRLSELQRRNTLCLPHMKSSYPVETQANPPQPDDLMVTSTRPNKYEQALKASTSNNSVSKYDVKATSSTCGSVQRQTSGSVVRESDDQHQFIKPSSAYQSCHRTVPAEIRNNRLAQSHDFSRHREDKDNNIVSIATPSKGFKTPKAKKQKTPRSSSTSKKKSAKKLGIDSSDNENEAYNRRESVRFEIPFSDKKPKRLGLGFGRKKDKESKSESKKESMPPPKESPKILRKPLNARNFLLFNNH